MTELLLIPALALLDRLRGGWFTGPTPPDRLKALRLVRPWAWALAMGLVIGWGLGLAGVELALCTVGFVLGERPGWGGPLGRSLTGSSFEGSQWDRTHWWQVGPLDNHWLALLARGAMWGAVPVVLVGMYQVFLDPSMLPQFHPIPWLIPIMALAMWAGAQLGKHFQIGKGSAWESSEWFRGALVGLCVALIGG